MLSVMINKPGFLRFAVVGLGQKNCFLGPQLLGKNSLEELHIAGRFLSKEDKAWPQDDMTYANRSANCFNDT